MYLIEKNFDLNKLLKFLYVKFQIIDIYNFFKNFFIENLNHDNFLKLL